MSLAEVKIGQKRDRFGKESGKKRVPWNPWNPLFKTLHNVAIHLGNPSNYLEEKKFPKACTTAQCCASLYQGSFDHVKVEPTPVYASDNLCCHIHIYTFIDILEYRAENKKKYLEKNCFRNVVSDLLKNGLNCT